MNYTILRLRPAVLILLGILFASPVFAGLSPKQIKLLHEACGEVLIKKPTLDSLTYEKELPWDLIPFNIRNDEYYSIGTAFAVSETELVSAFHVLQLGSSSEIFKELYIRDKAGNVYEVDKILQADNHRDFVRFTVKGKKFAKWLKVKPSYKIDDVVYSVGNAYGEGIIIRQGTLNGTVPESEKGEFVYLKSSSDANKGNSGGPLIDKRGNVVGVVVMKKDNITYSLPYDEILKAEKNKASFHRKMNFSFVVFPEEHKQDFDYKVKLPLDYKEVTLAYQKAFNAFYEKQMDTLFADNKKEIFPNGASSLEVLYGRHLSSLPQIVFKNKNNMKWTISNFESEDISIADNGKIRFVKVSGGLSFFDIQKPDSMALKDLYSKPRVLMDLILSSLNIPRKMANKEIRILSLGKPASTTDFDDGYGRKWQVSKWLIEYSDEYIITLSTPTPRGCITLFTTSRTGDFQQWIYDVKKITDFIYISYRGELAEWNEFLGQTAYIPSQFKKIKLGYEVNESFALETDRLKINLGKDLEITDKTELTLNFDFYPVGKEITWDVRRILVSEKTKDNYFSLFRHIKPDSALNESFQDNWKELATKSHPYNNLPFNEEGQTNIGSLHTLYENDSEKDVEKKEVVYSVFLAREGRVEDEEMQTVFTKLKEGVTILE